MTARSDPPPAGVPAGPHSTRRLARLAVPSGFAFDIRYAPDRAATADIADFQVGSISDPCRSITLDQKKSSVGNDRLGGCHVAFSPTALCVRHRRKLHRAPHTTSTITGSHGTTAARAT